MITERSQMKNLRPLVFVWSSLTLENSSASGLLKNINDIRKQLFFLPVL